MTEYVILRQSDEDPEAWTLMGEHPSSSSARAAVRKHQEEWREGGTFVAVPTRSWRPVTVKVETKTALRFS